MRGRSIRLLIAALGGEGGGVLTDWIVGAAMQADLPVQSTSIPGVAQRTGATTYYLEIFPETKTALAGRRPSLALYPAPGDIDVMIATELLEVGRSLAAGFVTPDRTLLIAATHRIYATIEKMAMTDGRFAGDSVLAATAELARRAVLFDLTRRPSAAALPLNAVLMGVLAGSGALPIPHNAFEEAIRLSGIAIESNLAGFAFGVALARDGVPADLGPVTDRPEIRPVALAETTPALGGFPQSARETIEAGVARLLDYQDRAYAELYLARLARICAVDAEPWPLLIEAARHLALWMSYEDIIRVAALKSRSDRIAKIRETVQARPGEPIRVTEFFKPGIEEIAALLPPWAGRRLQAWSERTTRRQRLAVPLRLRSTSIIGFLQLRLLACLKPWRRRTLRFLEEQAMMEQWLDELQRAAARDRTLALAILRCAQLLKGYGDTYRHGRSNFRAIFDRLIVPACVAATIDPGAAATIDRARNRALADPEASLADELSAVASSTA